MIALDTNVVVRLFVDDDAEQTRLATDLLRRAQQDGARLRVSHVTLCELAWVLESSYGFTRDRAADAIETLVDLAEVVVEAPDRVLSAAVAYRDGRGDFADHLVHADAAGAGCTHVATFDRKLHREPGFVSPDPRRWPDDFSLREPRPAYGRRRRSR